MKHLTLVATLAVLFSLTACSSLPEPSHPLDPFWTSHDGEDIMPVRQERDGDTITHHVHVFNASAQLASHSGFEASSAWQRTAALEQICATFAERQTASAEIIRYQYYWGRNTQHPLLSEFSIRPATDCQS